MKMNDHIWIVLTKKKKKVISHLAVEGAARRGVVFTPRLQVYQHTHTPETRLSARLPLTSQPVYFDINNINKERGRGGEINKLNSNEQSCVFYS